MTAEESQEAEFIRKAQAGDVEAFAYVVRSQQSRVRAYLGRFLCHSDTVDDIAQETFLGAFRNLQAYDGDSSFCAWLLGIAKNQALNYLRQEARRLKREQKALDLALAEGAAEQAAGESAENSDLLLAALQQCLKVLPNVSSQLVRGFYFEGRNAGQIGKALGRSENAVRLLLFRVRQQLRKCVDTRMVVHGSP